MSSTLIKQYQKPHKRYEDLAREDLTQRRVNTIRLSNNDRRAILEKFTGRYESKISPSCAQAKRCIASHEKLPQYASIYTNLISDLARDIQPLCIMLRNPSISQLPDQEKRLIERHTLFSKKPTDKQVIAYINSPLFNLDHLSNPRDKQKVGDFLEKASHGRPHIKRAFEQRKADEEANSRGKCNK